MLVKLAVVLLGVIIYELLVCMKAYMLYMSDQDIIPPRIEVLEEDGYIGKARKTCLSDIYNDN